MAPVIALGLIIYLVVCCVFSRRIFTSRTARRIYVRTVLAIMATYSLITVSYWVLGKYPVVSFLLLVMAFGLFFVVTLGWGGLVLASPFLTMTRGYDNSREYVEKAIKHSRNRKTAIRAGPNAPIRDVPRCYRPH